MEKPAKQVRFNQNSEKFIKAKNSLNPNLQSVFERLVNDYAFYALKNYGRNWAAYDVLADLIREGWRPQAD
jgi:hypothetical protein